MSYWENFSQLFSQKAQQYKIVLLPSNRVDVDCDNKPIDLLGAGDVELEL